MAAIPKKINGEKYALTVGGKIGSGAFGDVYQAKMNDGKIVALKFESLTAVTKFHEKERAVYRKLKGQRGFPIYMGSGTAGGYDFLILEMLGRSLESILKERGRPFGLGTVSKIGVQLLDCLERLHAQNIVHSDLKPANIAIGLNNPSQVHLLDFGLSVTIVDSDVPYRDNLI